MRIIIDELIEDKRLDSYLAECMQDISRSKIQSVIKKGNIKVNSSIVKPSYIIRDGDIIDFDDTEGNTIHIEPEDIPLDIVYEDDEMAVVNKPSGMLTHPTVSENKGTLVNALLFKYGDKLSDINGAYRRGIIHRLDRNTSGLLMIAKNNRAHEFLAKEMKEHNITKKYYAVIRGVPEQDKFEINKPIGRNPRQPNKMCIDDNGKESITRVTVIKRFKDAAFIELQLVTGRTHQIRVHMASIGHPVYNDTLYGFGKMKIKTDEQVLESYKLTFPHPYDGEKITVEIPYSEKLDRVLKFLNNTSL